MFYDKLLKTLFYFILSYKCMKAKMHESRHPLLLLHPSCVFRSVQFRVLHRVGYPPLPSDNPIIDQFAGRFLAVGLNSRVQIKHVAGQVLF